MRKIDFTFFVIESECQFWYGRALPLVLFFILILKRIAFHFRLAFTLRFICILFHTHNSLSFALKISFEIDFIVQFELYLHFSLT